MVNSLTLPSNTISISLWLFTIEESLPEDTQEVNNRNGIRIGLFLGSVLPPHYPWSSHPDRLLTALPNGGTCWEPQAIALVMVETGVSR